ncbi:hypothetical protein SEA_BARNSTORMER_42 [Microbacterium phage Barnstormer]|uniref:Uncharacterized protein n=1 Tax=Microbacterium phage Barnstormer TaxID=3028491 RepID=A0AAF0CDN3_9CAUD|nr:hypothetical protein SEA_BARNSTORMER_42 [Microbacterium phage Barnstormer]WDS52148.1 hypothetical protein SEA_UTZCHIPS_42 [Microbacterium phage UtzChips]
MRPTVDTGARAMTRVAPVAVLASTHRDGETYAETLAIPNALITTPSDAPGLEGRLHAAVVVSPRFAYLLADDEHPQHADAWRVFQTANRNSIHAGAPRG